MVQANFKGNCLGLVDLSVVVSKLMGEEYGSRLCFERERIASSIQDAASLPVEYLSLFILESRFQSQP